MLDITYVVTGAAEIARDLAKLRLDSLRADVGDILDDMAKDAATYPPERPGQRYRRTNKLHDGWLDAEPQFSLQGETLLATLINPTAYGPFVMGADDQAAAFTDRWRTTDAIMAAWEDRAAARIEDRLGVLVGP